MRETWRLIDTGGNNGFYNMAMDEAISIASREGKTPPTLRFYTWEPSCISIGYFQRIDKVLKREISYERDMEIVRRITGGRAVFHGNDLSYSIICNTTNKLFPGNLRGTYYTIAEALIRGLQSHGITPDPINPQKAIHSTKDRRTRAQNIHAKHGLCGCPTEYHRSTLCFATTLGHEISVNGKKLIGSAQRRWLDVFLQHGSILVTGPPVENGSASISISEILGDKPDMISIISALCTGFHDTLGINLTKGELTGYEKELAERLMEEKYHPS